MESGMKSQTRSSFDRVDLISRSYMYLEFSALKVLLEWEGIRHLSLTSIL